MKQSDRRAFLKTNHKILLKSTADLYAHAQDKDMIGDATFYMFHSKYNAQGKRQVFIADLREVV